MQYSLIGAAMLRQNLTSSDVRDRLEAQGVDVSLQTVRNWRAGTAVPQDRHRSAVAAVLGIELAALATDCATRATASDR